MDEIWAVRQPGGLLRIQHWCNPIRGLHIPPPIGGSLHEVSEMQTNMSQDTVLCVLHYK